jgi:hypothetical protein
MSDTAEPFTLVMQEDIQDATEQAPWEGGNDASYILDDQRRPVVSDHAAFAAMSDEAKTVAVTELGDNGFKVKTFFVGFDQSDGDEDEPLVFQTMAGLSEESWYVDAYPTWQQAEEGHKETVEHYRGIITKPVTEGTVH